jgi:UDP-hydrolysing UDP-N-acetyl-D-glucosamine 2-epimerase
MGQPADAGFLVVANEKTAASEDSAYAMAQTLPKIAQWALEVIGQIQPDVVLLPTDRYEMLAIASVAAIANVPIAHIQGGELSGTIDESVRHAVSKLAHIHFPATRVSADRLIRMGENPEHVHVVGCPGTDLLLRVDASKPPGFPKEPYVLVLLHPVTTEWENSAEQLRHLSQSLFALDMPIVWIGPNHDAGSMGVADAKVWPFFRSTVPHADFVRLMANAAVMVGNSSAGIREACYFGTPVVDIGSRQQGRERGGNVLHADWNTKAIRWAIDIQIRHGRYKPERLFGDGTAGKQIAKVLAGPLPPLQKRFFEQSRLIGVI